MARRRSKHPTELELEILKIIWRHGPCRVREVRERLRSRRKLAYTTIMTMMGILLEKGYLARRKDGGSFIYRPLVTETATTRRMLRDLVKRAFDGSSAAMVLNLLESGELDQAEIGKLREILNRKDKGAET